MPANDPIAWPGRTAPEALRCVSCVKALGSRVAFCPFCGMAQAKAAAAPPPAPAPPPVAPLPTPPAPVWSEASVPSPVPQTAFVQDNKPIPAPPHRPLPVVRLQPRNRWGRTAVIAAALAFALFVIRGGLAPAPTATLVVHVRGPNGIAVGSGHVLVDDKEAGTPGQSLTVSPGGRKVAFEEPGWRSEPRSVSIAKDAAVTIDLTAQELPGHIALTTNPPGAAVRIRNRSYGQSPLTLDLPPGSYDVSVTLNGYVGKTLPLTVIHGETRSIGIDLSSAPPPLPRFGAAPFDHGVLTAATPLQASPADSGETAAMLPAASEVLVLAQVAADEAWLQVRAAGRQGFVRASDVEAWDSWAGRNSVSGTVGMVTADLRVIIAGKAYPLAGVQLPERGFSAAGLGRVTAALADQVKGVEVRCTPQRTASFRCRAAAGWDVAELYLLNGGAVASDGAPSYYAESQKVAHDKQKGLWSE